MYKPLPDFIDIQDSDIDGKGLFAKQIIKENTKTVDVKVGSGENWDDFVAWSTRRNLYGIENLSLIPGSVGAAPIQNIGAYGCELKDVFIKIGTLVIFSNSFKILYKKELLSFETV